MGAGFIVFNDQMEILSLITHKGWYDLPKGTAEKGESPFETAQRECFEECNLMLSVSDLIYETYHNRNETQIFLARYPKDQEIIIKENPHTHKVEHMGWTWITIDEFMTNTKPYLLPHLLWAKTRLDLQ